MSKSTNSQQANNELNVVEPAAFDEPSLRSELIGNSGKELMAISCRTSKTICSQIKVIGNSLNDFHNIKNEISVINNEADEINTKVKKLTSDTEISSKQLEDVSTKMKQLEEKFSDVNQLLKTINSIADQTNLLALNATIEAARAGEEGKGFAVVAHEVKELSGTTKKANEDIQSKIHQIGESISELSKNVGASREKMNRSMVAMAAAKLQSDQIKEHTHRSKGLVDASITNFNDLEGSSSKMSVDLNELDTIAKSFSYLLTLMENKENSASELDPLKRLQPLVEQSTFFSKERFTANEEEYILAEDEILISATDLKGRITFANESFYRAAEYELGALVGKPHNVIRHPDMPKTAFEDLWSIIQQQKLWQGYVLNRGKMGRVYWVKAVVYPCFENNQCVGYLSVRSKPSSSAVHMAKEVYRKLQ